MHRIEVVPEAVRQYGHSCAELAATTAAAAAVDQTAMMACAAPVFGLIGQEFLGVFAVAQANHLSSAVELAGVHAGSALTAFEGASMYECTDDTNAVDFSAIKDL